MVWAKSGSAASALFFAAVLSAPVLAQNATAGKLAYTTPLVAGQLSCSAGACHTINPTNNQNKILKGADEPGAIGVAVNTVGQMAFLKGKMTTAQFIDLAAYIGNPAAASGSPSIALAPAALNFAASNVGASSSPQVLSISNTGTAVLNVSAVVSTLPDFALSGNCATVAVGANCSLSVTFTPTQIGSRTGNITVSHDAAGGSSSVALFGTGSAPPSPRISVPLAINFGSVMVDRLSDPVVLNVLSVGSAPLVITGMSINNNRFVITANTCVTDAPIAMNSACAVTLKFAPTSLGTQNANLNIQSNGSNVATVVSLTGIGTTPPPPTTKTMTEYWYAPLNFYFITSRDEEKIQLEQNVNFRRTGARFTVLAGQVGDAQGLVRYYFDKVAVGGSRGSHFYTLRDNEKVALNALNPNKESTPRLPVNEGIDSWAYLPLVAGDGGSCAASQVPVYRLFRGNAKFPDDPNHRFVIDPAIYREFVALGWDGEGVQLCLPPQ